MQSLAFAYNRVISPELRWKVVTDRGTCPGTVSRTILPGLRITGDELGSAAWLKVISVKKGKRPPALTKARLVEEVYERHGGLTKQEAAEIVEKIFTTVKSTLGDGRPVRIMNFGTFEVTSRPGRLGINPASGEKLFIPPHKGLNFRPSRRLCRAVRRRDADEE